jgi:hypothetical protein
MVWQGLWKYPQPTGEGTLPFRFENFGTFAGPQFESLNYNYDTASKEGTWHTLVPGDFSFKNANLGAYLYNNEFNYVGFHCDSVSTAMMTLEASYGNIPILNVFAKQTNVSGNILAVGDITTAGNLSCNGTFQYNGVMTLTGVAGDVATQINNGLTQPADIEHPTKGKGHRLRHCSLEGPEIAVYFRGKLKDSNVIELPEYWRGFVDTDSITVNLTPVGSYQELFVEEIQWGQKVIVKNNASGPIDCHFTVYGERTDMDKLIVEYEGETFKDYPGQDWQGVREEK